MIPVAFWWLSLLGGIALLAYANYQHDPVIVCGQAMGLVVYIRNLLLVKGARERAINYGSSANLVLAGDTRIRRRQNWSSPSLEDAQRPTPC